MSKEQSGVMFCPLPQGVSHQTAVLRQTHHREEQITQFYVSFFIMYR